MIHAPTLFRSWIAVCCAGALTACGGGREQGRTTPTTPSPAETSSAGGGTGASAPLNGINAPEISRSRGQPGGMVVLWPRVVPAAGAEAQHDLAQALQDHLRSLVARHFAADKIDVRPEPERVCPRNGCAAASAGVVLVHKGTGCAALAFVSPPGRTAATLIPWTDNVEIRAGTAPFRAPPESFIAVHDLIPCAHLVDALASHDEAVDEEIHRYAPE